MHTDKHTLEPWEHLQARLFHLGWLGEELPAFVATPGGAWLFREITREAQTIARIAQSYVAETEKAGLTSGNMPAEGTAGWPVTTAETDTVDRSVSGLDMGTATSGGDAL